MADSTVIKEFLIALGVKVDEAGIKKFTQTVVTATQRVMGIAAAAAAAAAAITAFVDQAAKEFEHLYYVSQRANATVESLKALQFAFGQTGMAGQSAADMLEQFSMSMRMNPAVEGLLQHFGVMTRGIGGKLRDTEGMLHDFVRKMKDSSLPFFAQAGFAQYFGLAPNQLLMLEAGLDKADEAKKRYLEFIHAMGFNSDAMATHSVKFENAMRENGTILKTFWDDIADHLMTRMTPTVTAINDFLRSHAHEIGQFIEHAFQMWDVLVLKFKIIGYKIINEITMTFNELKAPFLANIDAMEARLKRLQEWWENSSLKKLWGPEKDPTKEPIIPPHGKVDENHAVTPQDRIAPSWGTILRRFFGGNSGARPLTEEHPGVLQNLLGGEKINWIVPLRDDVQRLPKQIGEEFRNAMAAFGGMGGGNGGGGIIDAAFHPGGGNNGAGGSGYTGGGGTPPSGTLRARAQAIIPKLMASLGISSAGASGIAAMLGSESGINPGTVAAGGDFGLAQWVGSRRDSLFAFAKRMGGDVRSFDTQFQFMIQEMKSQYPALIAQLKGITDPAQAARIMAPYEAGGMAKLLQYHYNNDPGPARDFLNDYTKGGALGQGGGAGGGAPTVNQKTDIHVHGTGDPHKTAEQVEASQQRINSNIIRNLSNSAVYA